METILNYFPALLSATMVVFIAAVYIMNEIVKHKINKKNVKK